jgi:hypothetical protein
LNLNLSYAILPVQPGALVNIAGPGALPPVGAPAPMLEPADVLDPPLPPVLAVSTAAAPAPTRAADNSTSAASTNAGSSLLAAGIVALLSLRFLQ